MIYAFYIVWMGYWAAESGASLPWSEKWQNFKGWNLRQVPEMIVALTIGLQAVWGWDTLFNIPALYIIGGFIAFVAIAYAGKQSATYAYLKWTSHEPRKDHEERDGTLRGFNDFIGSLFGYRLGDEGYSWIWAATKGLIMTLPIGGFGVITHPLGHELGSHGSKYLGGDFNMWKEIGGGIGIGAACALFHGFIVILG